MRRCRLQKATSDRLVRDTPLIHRCSLVLFVDDGLCRADPQRHVVAPLLQHDRWAARQRLETTCRAALLP